MKMRIISGRIQPGQWDEFEAAFKRAMAGRAGVKGLHNQWLGRDQRDPDASHSVILFDSDEDMKAFVESPERNKAWDILKEFYGNHYSSIDCDVPYAVKG